MAKSPKKPKPEEIKTYDDGWSRYVHDLDVLSKTMPKLQKAKPKKEIKPKNKSKRT